MWRNVLLECLVRFLHNPKHFIMHTAISYNFAKIVDMNRVKTRMHNKCTPWRCMEI